jgi:hypothetical protein
MSSGSKQTDVMTTRLLDLERLLLDEADALKRMDRAAIDQFTEQKLALSQEIGELGAPAPEHLELVARVKSRVMLNQMLLVSARDCIRGVIELATGSVVTGGYSGERLPGRPRLSVRG